MNIHIVGIMTQSSRLVEARNCWMEAAVAPVEETAAAEEDEARGREQPRASERAIDVFRGSYGGGLLSEYVRE